MKYFLFLLLTCFCVNATTVQLVQFEGVSGEKALLREKVASSLQRYATVTVAERTHLKTVLDEQLLQESGVTNGTVSLGEIAAVDEIVTGSVVAANGQYVAVLKRISVKTSALVHSCQIAYKSLEALDEKRIAKELYPHGGDRPSQRSLDTTKYTTYRVAAREIAVAKREVSCAEVVRLVNWALQHVDSLALSEVSLIDMRNKRELLSVFGASNYFSAVDKRLATSTPEVPATGVTWYGAAFLCNVHSLMSGVSKIYSDDLQRCCDTGMGFRLLRDKEYTAIVRELDTTGGFHEVTQLDTIPHSMTHTFFENSVSEWVHDRSDDDNERVEDFHLIRGSAWYHNEKRNCLRRASMRGEESDNGVGFRFVFQKLSTTDVHTARGEE